MKVLKLSRRDQTDTTEDSGGSPIGLGSKKDIVKIRLTRAGSIRVIEEDYLEEIEVDPSPVARGRPRHALNSPFSHEQISDSLNATRYAVHLG